MSSTTIEQKLEQLYAALAEMRVTEKLASMRPARVDSGGRFAATLDFTKIEKPATAANRVSTLVSNIASLKDHLHAWCRKNGKPETGDQLINSDRDVAIIHDLWNLDKHAELNRPSRSGLSPRLQPAHTTLEFKVTTSEETPLITIPVFGGPIQAHGDANVRITATVVDKDGNSLGDLEPICLRAVAAWQAEFVKAGIKIVPSPEQQKEYTRLSALLQAIGIRHRPELPSGATSLLMKVMDGNVLVEVYDRMGKKIGDIPDAKTSSALRDALQQTFQSAISPDHDGVIAII
ncbi:MAG: hypothetical protein WCA10_03955 [Terracidiphilus sp.]